MTAAMRTARVMVNMKRMMMKPPQAQRHQRPEQQRRQKRQEQDEDHRVRDHVHGATPESASDKTDINSRSTDENETRTHYEDENGRSGQFDEEDD